MYVREGVCDGPAGAQASGAVFEDPHFRSAATRDFHLSDGSPVIDAAATTRVPAEDFDGVSRPQGAGYDIGAFEYERGRREIRSPGRTAAKRENKFRFK